MIAVARQSAQSALSAVGRIGCLRTPPGGPHDGLAHEWYGRVWLNPPFDPNLLPKFLAMMVEHNNGIALLPVSVTTRWWKAFVWPRAHSILFLHEKLVFYRGATRDKKPRSHMDRSEALVAYGAKNTAALKRSGIAGQLVYGSL